MSAFNFIGVPMFLLVIASLIGLLIGIIKKNKKLILTSSIILIVIIIVYGILFILIH